MEADIFTFKNLLDMPNHHLVSVDQQLVHTGGFSSSPLLGAIPVVGTMAAQSPKQVLPIDNSQL